MYNKKVLYKKRQKVTNHKQSTEQRKWKKENRHQIAKLSKLNLKNLKLYVILQLN